MSMLGVAGKPDCGLTRTILIVMTMLAIIRFAVSPSFHLVIFWCYRYWGFMRERDQKHFDGSVVSSLKVTEWDVLSKLAMA